jgi:hypothetical protein
MAVTQSRDATEARTEKGISLARGPALIVGTILLAAGLYFLYRQHNFPKLSNFPNGKARVDGKVFGVFGANGWTGMLIAVAGGLLLFGAAQHLLAKTISLIVGVALAVAVVIAVASGDVLGLAAANGWTEFAWGVVAAILLLNTVIPRRRKTVAVVEARGGSAVGRDTRAAQPVGATRPGASTTGAGVRSGVAGDPVADREGPSADDTAADREGRYADERGGAADEPGAGGAAGVRRPYADESGAAATDPEAGKATSEAPRVESQDPPRERPA